MKTITQFTLLLSFLISSTLYAATGGDNNTGSGTDTKSMKFRVDMLKEDMVTQITNVKEVAFQRYVQLDVNGNYAVQVVSVGIMKTVRMEGTYLDSELQIPHGAFTYYHPNGRVESKGDYSNGVKTGIWHRTSISGKELAEKVYTGRSIEQALIAADQISVAKTQHSSRKWTDAIEF